METRDLHLNKSKSNAHIPADSRMICPPLSRGVRRTSITRIYTPSFAVFLSQHQCCCSDPEEEHDDFNGDAEDRAHGGAAGEGVLVEVVQDYGVESYCEGEDHGDDYGAC